MSARCIAGTIDAVSTELPGRDSWYKDMPIMRSAVEFCIELYDSARLLGICVIEEDDLHMGGMVEKMLKFTPEAVNVGPNG
jgi:hypothetical protein